MDLVWPPTLVGKRKASFTDPYVHDSDAEVQLTLHKRFIKVHPSTVVMMAITIESVKCDQCPVYVFPPSAEGFIRAMYLDCHSNKHSLRATFPKLMAGWTLKYATVEDMARIDPDRKLVNWFAVDISKEINKDVPIRIIGTPEYLPALHKEEFQAELRKLNDAENVQEIDIMEPEDFESKLKSIVYQDRLEGAVETFLKTMTFRRSHMKEACALDGVRFAKASFERLSSLGLLLGEEREHAANAFTSRLIHRGTQRELETIQRITAEMRRATATKRQLTQIELDHLESTRLLVEKQDKEMIQHLDEWATKSQTLMEEAMLSKVKLVTFLRQTEKEASVLQNFFSSGATEIVEEANKDALKEQEQELMKKAKDQEQELMKKAKEQEQELMEKAKSNQECCICYHGLEGFSVATSDDGEKLHKRACFLPCMHANVCTTCSEKRWNEGPKECPICRQPLTERPRVIYL